MDGIACIIPQRHQKRYSETLACRAAATLLATFTHMAILVYV
jgi:hypothetical protein